MASTAGLPVVRRDAIALMAAAAAVLSLHGAHASPSKRLPQMKIACFIRYQIDPSQREEFRKYAEAWRSAIPRCGGHLIGYFLPHEGTNDIAWGLIGFESLAAYEAYRARLRADPGSRDNFTFAQTRKFILREERTFVELVAGSFDVPPQA